MFLLLSVFWVLLIIGFNPRQNFALGENIILCGPKNISCTTEYVFAVHVIKDLIIYDSLQIVSTMIDNKSSKQVQKRDEEDMSNDNVGDKIFSLFLIILCSTVISIIHLKSCMSENTTYE